MKKNLTLFFAVLFIAFVVNAQVRYLKGTLQASQEGPGVTSAGTGVVIVKYNMATRLLEHFGNYRGLTANITNQHIHTGAPGISGPVTIPLAGTGGTSGGLTGSQTLTLAQEADLLAGNMYTNVHTSTYSNGEVRAQLTLTTNGQTEFFNAKLQGAQQTPPDSSLATGMVHALIDKSLHMLYLTGTYTGLTTPANNAHIHKGVPNIAGPVIIPLIFTTTTSGALDTSLVITIADQDSILSGNTYVNIHTATYPNGEIRGQLTQLSQIRFLANALQASQEVPVNTSAARGTVIVKYNTESNVLTLTGDYQNLTATINGSHIHGPSGPPGMNAPILFNLTNTGGTTGTLNGTFTLTEPQEADLLAGNMYANVHSTGTYSAGEIRAQLLVTSAGDTHFLTGLLQASQSVATPAVVSSGTGNATVLVDKTTSKVYVTANFSNLTSNINNTHIHGGKTGVNGPVIIPLFYGGTTSGTITGVAVTRSTFADSIVNGFSYLNIHTINYGSGEIRAQLGDLVLPVKLTYFNGYKDYNQVALIWESAQEVNLSRYEIQQQSESGDWLTKATALATGGTNATKYRVSDVPLSSKTGYVFYRLKMLDKDGQFTYSQVLKLNFKQANMELTIFANPIQSNEVKYAITGLATDQKAEVRIVDMNGRPLYKYTTSSLGNHTIQVGTLSQGMYKLMVSIQGQLLQQTFSK